MKLSNVQIDAIKEIINMGTGRAANILNKMFSTKVVLKVPEIKITETENVSSAIIDKEQGDIASVNLAFRGNFSGTAKLLFPTESATKLISVFTEEETSEEEMDEIRSATLAEIGNIVLNSLMGTIGNTLELLLSYSIPTFSEDRLENLLCINNSGIDRYALLAHTHFSLDELNVTGDFILIFEIGSLNEFIFMIDEYIEGIEE